MAEGYVYFASLDGLVKIGWSRSPTQRAHSLRAELLAVESGTRFDEGKLLRRFAVYQVRGEWFSASPEIMTYIQGLPSYSRLHPSPDMTEESHP